MRSKVKHKSITIVIVMAIISIILLVCNFTLAIYNDTKTNTGIVQFSQHKLDIEIIGNDSIILSPEELTVGSNTTRTLNIINPANSIGCVFRMWLEFKIDGESSDYLSLTMDETRFSLNSNEDKYYYNGVLQTGGKIENLVLNFNVDSSIEKSYQGKPYSLKLYVESIQSTKEAVGMWKEDYTPAWYELVKNSLT